MRFWPRSRSRTARRDLSLPAALGVGSKACDLELEFSADSPLTISLFGLDLEYRPGVGLVSGELTAPVKGEDGLVKLRLLYDTLSVEAFADSGSVFLGLGYIQDRSLNTLRLTGPGTLRRLELRELGAFWEE